MEGTKFYVHEMITFALSGNLMVLALKLSQSEKGWNKKVCLCVYNTCMYILCVYENYIYNILYILFSGLFLVQNLLLFAMSSDFLFDVIDYKCYAVECC